MTNPLYRAFHDPVLALTDAAWVMFLLFALTLTWWAAGRNIQYLREFYQETPDGVPWQYLPPAVWAFRAAALLLVLGVDLVLLAGIVGTFA